MNAKILLSVKQSKIGLELLIVKVLKAYVIQNILLADKVVDSRN